MVNECEYNRATLFGKVNPNSQDTPHTCSNRTFVMTLLLLQQRIWKALQRSGTRTNPKVRFQEKLEVMKYKVFKKKRINKISCLHYI